MNNPGISFGLQIPGILWLVIIVWLVVVFEAIRTKNWGWWLMAWGGGMNLVERLRLGYVRDYWKLPILGIYNNLYDWLIFGGVVVILWSMFSKKSK